MAKDKSVYESIKDYISKGMNAIGIGNEKSSSPYTMADILDTPLGYAVGAKSVSPSYMSPQEYYTKEMAPKAMPKMPQASINDKLKQGLIKKPKAAAPVMSQSEINPMDRELSYEDLIKQEYMDTLSNNQAQSLQQAMALTGAMAEPELDTRPISALVDQWSGSNFSKIDEKPQDVMERGIAYTSPLVKNQNEMKSNRLMALKLMGDERANNLANKYAMMQMKLANKQNTDDEKNFKELGHQLEVGGRGDIVLKNLKQKELSIDKGLGVLSNPNIIKNRAMMEEAAFDIATAISPAGTVNRETVNGLTTDTLYGTLSNIAQYLTGKPLQGPPDAIINQYLEQLTQLKSTNKQQMQDIRRKLIDNNYQLLGRNPQYKRVLEDRYFSDTNNAGAAPQLPSLSGEDAEALNWANANPTDPRAAAIKQKLGVK